jgi:hypothetical protein
MSQFDKLTIIVDHNDEHKAVNCFIEDYTDKSHKVRMDIGEDWMYLPISQVKYRYLAKRTKVEITLPRWLAEKQDLLDYCAEA